MSQENVELLRSMLRAVGARRLRLDRVGCIPISNTWSPTVPNPAAGRGWLVWREAWGAWVSAWEDLRIEVDEYRDAG